MPRNRHASRSTRLTVLLAFAVALLASHASRVWANPSFSDDFTAFIISLDLGAFWTPSATVDHPLVKYGLILGVTGGGDMFMDYTGQRARFKMTDRDIYLFYNDRRSYEISARTGHCRSRVLHGQPIEMFGWLDLATKLTDSCLQLMDSGAFGVQYELEVGDGKFLEFCGSTDEKTPYWVGWRNGRLFAWVQFRTHTPGTPADAAFELPDSCFD